jgi:lipopolysaccharide transport system ATP-binding protein
VTGPLVVADGLCKRYPVLGHAGDRTHALWDLMCGRPPRRQVSVLENIGFTVQPGESVGIIGENGAGKSTLLKLITGVLTPSAGRVRTEGSIGALLELGAGFHPEYSGRENVRMAAVLYGLDDATLARKLPEIEAFADIGDYLDEPVKHYSTGMVVRLGFAVIAAVRPALLVTDEVLSVGDESFQKKCTRWIDDYLAGGGTLLLVSHSMYHVQKLCRQAIWLHEGRIQAQGDVFAVTQRYLAWHEAKQRVEDDHAVAPPHSGGYAIESINGDPQVLGAPIRLAQGDSLDHEVIVRAPPGPAPTLMCGWVRADGTAVYGTSSEMAGMPGQPLGDGRFRFHLRFDALPLLPGSYLLRTHVLDTEGLRMFCTSEREVLVTGATRELGIARLPHRWLGPGELP